MPLCVGSVFGALELENGKVFMLCFITTDAKQQVKEGNSTWVFAYFGDSTEVQKKTPGAFFWDSWGGGCPQGTRNPRWVNYKIQKGSDLSPHFSTQHQK